MEIHQIRYVVAVARTGNFSRAAEQCHVAQPSLSQQILKLEDELGEKLFERLKTGARLTSAGEVFLPHAVRILDEIEATHREMQDAQAQVRGVISIGVLPTIAPYYLPKVIAQFSDVCPNVEVVVQEDTTARLLKMATACEVDLAILSPPLPETGFEYVPLFTEELVLALPPKHPFVSKPTITAHELETERFILMKEGHCLGDQVLRFCDRRDFHPSVSFRSAQIETVQALVEAGMGISLIPRMACRTGRESHPVYRSLEDPRPYRSIVAAWNSQRPPNRLAKEFLRHLHPQEKTGKNEMQEHSPKSILDYPETQRVPWWGL